MKIKKHTKEWFIKYLILIPLLLGIIGCENGGGGHDYDFGDNNPSIAVATGDSITAGCGLSNPSQEAYPTVLAAMSGKTVYNRGVSGSESGYGVSTVNSNLEQYKPGYLLILYGINDIIRGRNVQSIINNLQTMIRAAKQNKTVPIIATLTPLFGWYKAYQSLTNTLNEQIRWLASSEDVPLADLAASFDFDASYIGSDGLHPNKQGQQLIAATFCDQM